MKLFYSKLLSKNYLESSHIGLQGMFIVSGLDKGIVIAISDNPVFGSYVKMTSEPKKVWFQSKKRSSSSSLSWRPSSSFLVFWSSSYGQCGFVAATQIGSLLLPWLLISYLLLSPSFQKVSQLPWPHVLSSLHLNCQIIESYARVSESSNLWVQSLSYVSTRLVPSPKTTCLLPISPKVSRN